MDSIRLLHATICEEIGSGRLSTDSESLLEELLVASFKLIGQVKQAHAVADTGKPIVSVLAVVYSVACLVYCHHTYVFMIAIP